MATLYLLGTGSSLSDPQRTATMLAVENEQALILIDSGGDSLQRLLESGFPEENLAKLKGIIISHEHADHVSGFPLLWQKLWLYGQHENLKVYGIAPALNQVKKLIEAMDSFHSQDFAGLPPLEWHKIPYEVNSLVLEDEGWHILASPAQHSVPVMAFRITDKLGGGVVCYSCDTEKSEQVVQLAQGADILVHEATGDFTGHSSAAQAAEVAQAAQVKKLLLVHLPPERVLTDEKMARARAIFPHLDKGLEKGRYPF
ncbi:MAG: ribonuclease Z [Deinococcales bacterium]